jgi:DNA-binding transcriptional LysR family regulator
MDFLHQHSVRNHQRTQNIEMGEHMSIETFKDFTVLARVKCFSIASKELFISQSTLSRRISALEDTAGLKLINRTNPLTLTTAGERLLVDAARVVKSYEDFIANAEKLKLSKERELLIHDLSYSDHAKSLLYNQAQVFGNKYPRVSIRFVPSPVGMTIWSTLQKGVLDICFSASFGRGTIAQPPVVPQGIGVVEAPTHRRSLAFLVRKDNPILKTDPRSLADIKTLSYMFPADSFFDSFREEYTKFCQAEGGFTPTFDLRAMVERQFFYSQDPGESAIFIGRPAISDEDYTDDSLVPKFQREQMALLSLDEYSMHTFISYDEEREDEILRAFIEQLLE